MTGQKQKKREPKQTALQIPARPRTLSGVTIREECACGKIYITINDHDDPKVPRPFEILIEIGKAGGCAAAWSEALEKIFSRALQSGCDCKDLVSDLVGIVCHRGASCVDAVGRAVRETMEAKEDCQ